MQRITTKEPDDSMIEVAIAALKGAMPEEFPEEDANPDESPEETSGAEGEENA
ncbi:MAG: DUF1385 domain-containing protein [Eubacteriales bacterium]|nr:DUF1385 domain-containing protein [Eubacteriales bacterium]